MRELTDYHCYFGYGGWDDAMIPQKNILDILEPASVNAHNTTDYDIVRESLLNPIHSPRLASMVKGCSKILILADDYTRLTPAHLILPLLLEELVAGGITINSITILVASGTHRCMDDQEKRKKYGDQIVNSIPVVDHVWHNPDSLQSLGKTAQGTEIEINKKLLEADFVIGIGHIVPHRVAGFSGGAKIVQPGVCGAKTTGQTHWLSAKYFSGKQIIGVTDNPVREEINEVGLKAGLQFIINTVQAGDGHIHSCFSGDPIVAHNEGCKASLLVYGAPVSGLADIVIVDSFPANVNMWQASKGVYSADLALEEDGLLILVTPCPEGVAHEHPEIEHFGYADPDSIERMVDCDQLDDLTIAAHILHVGRVITGKRKAILVTPGIPQSVVEHLGFIWAANLEEAVGIGFKLKGKHASVSILRHGGEVMPIYG
ncbi:MAG TPA: nickel-dependent lactate racemase [Sphaerochaeta sp.]|nr:nickel-dependent lactate racemase [Sphaerochaeta sp.]